MKYLLILAGIAVLVLFFIRRFQGWSSWLHLLEVAGYGAVLGLTVGIEEDGWGRGVLYGLVTGTWLGLMYWVLIPRHRPSDQPVQTQRSRAPILSLLISLLPVAAIVYFVAVVVFPDLLIPLSVGLGLVAILATMAALALQRRGRRGR